MRILLNLLTNRIFTTFFCLTLAALTADAATLTVTKIEDTNDGACDSDCSLREAIAAAQSGDTVVFSALFDAAQTITLSDANGFQDLIINKNLTITGKGANLLTVQRDAAATANFRIFTINSPATAVALSGMTVTGGKVFTSIGGGGAIYLSNSQGTLTVSDCYINANSATSNNDGGGGVASLGSLLIRRSTISNNVFTAGNNSASGGGGIFYGGVGSATFELTNSTVSGNTVGGASDSNGGGVYLSGVNHLITDSTVTDNAATGASSASGVYGNSNTIVRGTIVAADRSNASAPDVVSASISFVSQGYNLIGNAGSMTGFNQAGDQTGTSAAPLNPMLQSLALNGGTMPSHALIAGSLAIDAGNSFGLTTDQRGSPRPFDNSSAPPAIGGDNSDIGAFEAGSFAPLVVTKIEDTNDGVCDSDCSLREAIAAAPARGGEITFSSLFDQPKTITLSGANGFGALVINKNLAITGKGANLLTVQRDPATSANFSVFSVDSQNVGISVVLSGMTITGGRSGLAGGGGILFRSPDGALTVSGCSITGNTSQSPATNNGGGIASYGRLTVTNSTVSNNVANYSNNNSANNGGGIYVFNKGSFILTDSTVSGNVVSGASNSSVGAAGGVFIDYVSNGNARISNSTVTDNGVVGASGAGGIVANSNTMLRSSIVAANRGNTTAPDIQTTNTAITSGGYNLIGSAPAGIGFANGANNDKVGSLSAPINPYLEPLGNYGGTTPTHRLRANSPAIDAGNSFGLTTDQRGSTRPVDIAAIANGAGDASDIGAFETQNGYLAPGATDDSYSAVKNTVLNVNAPGVLANDANPSGGALTAVLVTNPANGSLIFRQDGSFSYTPNANSVAGDSFTYKINDGTSDSNVATVSINFENTRAGSSFVVTKIEDTNDGVCDSDCSLREAINATADGGTVGFASPLFDSPQIITLRGDAGFQSLVVNKNLTINGPGANLLAIDHDLGEYRIFNVSGSSLTVNLNNLTIENGDAGANSGGGISASGGVTLNVANCSINGNQAALGGGIYVSADSHFTLTNSTIWNNAASGNAAGGGGIHNEGTMIVVNSTVSGNSKTGGANNDGGGIWSNLTANISNSTVTDNAADGAGGLYLNGGTITVSGSIVAANRNNNSTPDVFSGSGNFSTSGYNLIGSAPAGKGFTNNSNFDQVGTTASPVNPKLRGLIFNGGQTRTHALGVNSPALDKGRSFRTTTDQRGFTRPFDLAGISNAADGADIGAFEAQAAPTNTAPAQPSATPNPIVIDQDTTGYTGVSATDPEGDNLTFVIAAQPAHGTIFLGATNCGPSANDYNCFVGITYQPNAGYSGADSFGIKANDGQFDSPVLVVNITVRAVTRTLVVTKTADTNDGACDADCSLREAIAAARGGDTIAFASPLFDTPQVITLNPDSGFQNLVVSKNLTINGTGANLLKIERSTSTSNTFRIFNINGGGVTVNLNNLTISGGDAYVNNGGGINANGGVTLNISGCHITGNKAAQGGGIYITSDSRLTLSNSTISANQVVSNQTSAGGIHNEGTLTIINSTVSGNFKTGTTNNSENGGGIWTNNTTTITGSTVTDNQVVSANGADGIFRSGSVGAVTIADTIVAANRNNANDADVAGAFVSNGYNLIGNVSSATGFNQTGDQTGTSAAILDPRLDPLGDYGGTTPTHRLQTSPVVSPAIDKGNSFGLTTDQRGQTRPFDIAGISNAADGADVGAFEVQNFVAQTGNEGDIANRPNGDGFYKSDDLIQLRRFLNGADTPDSTTNEFQRADSAPYATRGDGALCSSDLIQLRRYLNGADAPQAAGGPTAQTSTCGASSTQQIANGKQFDSEIKNGGEATQGINEKAVRSGDDIQAPQVARELRVESPSPTSAGQTVTFNIRVDALGDESAYSFRLNYNQSVLTNPVFNSGTTGAAIIDCDASVTNRIGCTIEAFPTNNPASGSASIKEIGAGDNQLLLSITFTVMQNAAAQTVPLTLSNVSTSNDQAQNLAITATNGSVTITGPTAAPVSIGGRVMTSGGRGISGVQLSLIDSQGNTRTAISTRL